MTNKNILIVDNEPGILRLLHHIVTRRGMTPWLAANATEALARLAAQPPDMILTDWRMPDMSGLDLAHLVKNAPQTAHVPVVLLTGMTAANLKLDLLPIDAILLKPFALQELYVLFDRFLLSPLSPTDSTQIVTAF
jgi:CheY-like chemotaxis protein